MNDRRAKTDAGCIAEVSTPVGAGELRWVRGRHEIHAEGLVMAHDS